MLIGIEHDTRRLHLLGMTPHPDGAFMQQVAREATTFDGALADRTMVILDNDSLFTKAFRGTITDADCEIIRTAIMAPNMIAHAERVIQSIKTECLDHFVFLNETMLYRALSEYLAHYNTERPHQGLEQRTVSNWPYHGNKGDIVVDERLGGLLKSARRLAA
ncbi:MAG: integrase core domain-containing protein [Planctomycetota bacterium]|nr:integrase core domain-containing protein [Planctomycetota bacterium]